MNWLKLRLVAIAKWLSLTPKASIDSSKISRLEKKFAGLEQQLEAFNKSLGLVKEQQEEFKEEFSKITKIIKKANDTVGLAASNINELATTQAMMAAEIVRINSGFDDLMESLAGPENQIDIRFFRDDDIYH